MIEWSRVEELQAEIGAEDFAEVVALFLEEADEAVATLAGTGDAATLEATLHFIKGSALNLGLRDLAQLCSEGERAAADGRAESVQVDVIARTYTLSKADLERGILARRAA